MFDREQDFENAKMILEQIFLGKSYNEISNAKGFSKDWAYKCLRRNKARLNIPEKDTVSPYHWLTFTGEIKNLVSTYVNEKQSMTEIGKKYNLSERTIANYLKREGIVIRSSGVISRTNQNIFLDIDSEIKAYSLGLITADGSVSKDQRSASITLTEKDGYILEQINEELLNNSGHILITHKEDVNPRKVLQFHGKEICSSLERYNIIPNKTYLLQELSNLIPQEFYHHYIRGLYDGDGVCAKSTVRGIQKIRIGFCGHNKEFVESYRDFLNQELNLPLNKIFNTGGCWQVSWSAIKDLNNFYNYIYKDAHIFLGRKKNKLYNYIANTEVI